MNFFPAQGIMTLWVAFCESCLKALSIWKHCYVSCVVNYHERGKAAHANVLASNGGVRISGFYCIAINFWLCDIQWSVTKYRTVSVCNVRQCHCIRNSVMVFLAIRFLSMLVAWKVAFEIGKKGASKIEKKLGFFEGRPRIRRPIRIPLLTQAPNI